MSPTEPRPCLHVLTRTSPLGWHPAPLSWSPRPSPGPTPVLASVEGIPCTSRVAEPHDEGGRQDAPPGPSGPGSASRPLEDTPHPAPWILQSRILQLLEESLGAKSAPLQQVGSLMLTRTRPIPLLIAFHVLSGPWAVGGEGAGGSSQGGSTAT